MGDLSAHFSKAELACHCCAQLIVDPGLIDALEQLRGLAGKPIKIHDGYRCPAHNEQAGGVANSEHTRGLAADIEITGLTLQEMCQNIRAWESDALTPQQKRDLFEAKIAKIDARIVKLEEMKQYIREKMQMFEKRYMKRLHLRQQLTSAYFRTLTSHVA